MTDEKEKLKPLNAEENLKVALSLYYNDFISKLDVTKINQEDVLLRKRLIELAHVLKVKL